MSERPEESRVVDPTISGEPDLRLTLREWVIYWKTKYESMLLRFQDVADLLGKQKQMMKDQTLVIARQNDEIRELNKQLHDLQESVQAERKKAGGVPNPIESKKKLVKKGK